MAGNDKFTVTAKKEKVTITIRLPPDVSERLEELSRQSGQSKNELINKALEFALSHQEK